MFLVSLTEGNNNDNNKQNEYVAVKLITAHAKKQTDTANDITDKANDDKELLELIIFGLFDDWKRLFLAFAFSIPSILLSCLCL